MSTRRLMIFALLLALLLPANTQAAQLNGGWQIYTALHGLFDPYVWSIEGDGAGGFWAGYVAGGRGIGRPGGLVHTTLNGWHQLRPGSTSGPLDFCPSVDEIERAPNGTIWLRISGVHDYGSSDYLGRCSPTYGGGLAWITPPLDSTVNALNKEQLPADMAAGLAIDHLGRPWVGTEEGAAVRQPDGSWTRVALWSAGRGKTSVLHISADGRQIGAGSYSGQVAQIAVSDSGGSLSKLYDLGTSTVLDATPDLRYAATSHGILAFRDDQWQQLPKPVGESDFIYTANLEVVNGTLWLSGLGLQHFDGNQWVRPAPGSTPLPSEQVNDMTLDGSRLLLGTSNGAAHLDPAAPPADPSQAQTAFTKLWNATEQGGSWIWGPKAWNERYEPYKEGPGGTRYVRYYDKTRMELTHPDGDPNSRWYVTNGLLVVELVQGRVQLADYSYNSSCPIPRYTAGMADCPAYIPIAGDRFENVMAPVYGDFVTLMRAQSSRVGQTNGATLLRPEPYQPPALGYDASRATPETTGVYYDDVTGHTIPRVFMNFLDGQKVAWIYSFGRPITEAYWIKAKVGGVEKWVLVQLFERRALTYTPSNPAGWQVEMGNVGQHYYDWRYSGQPWQ